MPNALAIEGLARAFNVRAIVVDIACPCCDGCPLWRRLEQCPQGPSDCVTVPPPPLVAWICDGTLCTNGSPLAAGTVVRIDAFCFRVTNITSPNPVGILITDPGPFECAAACDDPICPQGTLYWPAVPCSQVNDENPQIVWVCGVPPGCHIRQCLVIDGGLQPVRYEDIPQDPPPVLARFIDLTPASRNCCDCLQAVPCVNTALLDFDPTGDPCGPFTQDSCCCQYENGVPTTTYRITRCVTTQRVERPAFPGSDSEGEYRLELTDDCTPVANYVRTGFGQPDDTFTGLPNIAAACYRRCGGTWPRVAPRITQLNGTQLIVGNAGQTWGNSCLGFEDAGQRLEVVRFQTLYTCDRFTQIAEYRYTERSNPADPRIFTTRFEFTAEIQGPNKCKDCTSVVSSGTPLNVDGTVDLPQAPVGGGCSGCGQGQGRSPA